MTLTKLLEVQKGPRTLRLFRAIETGMLFVAVDKVTEGWTTRGPFLSEGDLKCLIDIVNRHKAKRREWVRSRIGKSSIPVHPTYDLSMAQVEVADAIRRIHETSVDNRTARIKVLPSMPKYTYCHACSICGCHIESHLRLGPGTALKLCPNCGHTRAATE